MGKLDLVLMGRAMLSKSLIQFSVDGWNCVPSLLFTWGQTIREVMKITVTSFKRPQARTAALSAPEAAAGHFRPAPLQETPGHFRACLGQSLVGSLLLSPGSWCTQGFVCALQEYDAPVCFPQSCGSSIIKFHCHSKSNSLGVLSPFGGSPGWDICCGP